MKAILPKKEQIEDIILVTFDKNGTDEPIMLVGRKPPRKDVEIINAFKGPEAEELYKKLTGNKEKQND